MTLHLMRTVEKCLLSSAFVYIAFVPSCTWAKPSLSDSEIKSIVERSWNQPSRIQLGDFHVLAPNAIAKPPRRYIPWSTYEQYQAWHKAGVVILQENFNDPEKDSLIWIAQQIAKRVFVSATESTSKFKEPSGASILLPTGKYSVTRVVKNEERVIGTNDFRLTMFTFDFSSSREVRDYLKARNERMSEKRKAIVLFRFDPFESIWKIHAVDRANADENFRTNNVENALAR